MKKKSLVERNVWKAKVRQWLEGNLNAKHWCRENNVSYDRFFHWRREVYPEYRKTLKEVILSDLPARPLYLCCSIIDLRNGFDALTGLAFRNHENDLRLGALFAFVNVRFNIVKVLYWQEDGLVIWCKHLERGTFILDRSHLLLKDETRFTLIS